MKKEKVLTKKEKALAMYYSEKFSKSQIENILKLKAKKLSQWIKEWLEVDKLLDPNELIDKKVLIIDSYNENTKTCRIHLSQEYDIGIDKLIRKKALAMYKANIPKEEICKILLIPKYQLNNWIIKSNAKPIKEEVKSKDYVKRHTARQPGRTNWLTQICKNNKALYCQKV